jgi:hypothetical protein
MRLAEWLCPTDDCPAVARFRVGKKVYKSIHFQAFAVDGYEREGGAVTCIPLNATSPQTREMYTFQPLSLTDLFPYQV